MGFGIGIGPRILRVRVSTRGVGIGSGVGPLSVWASTGGGRRRRRRNHVHVRSTGVRYLTEPVAQPSMHAIPMADVTGADAHALAPTGPDDLVDQLNIAAKMQWWPWLAVATVGIAFAPDSPWIAVLVLLIGLPATGWLWSIERSRHTVEVTYDVEGPVAQWFDVLASGWPQLSALQGAWRINTQGRIQTTHHHKTNAGASHLVSRGRLTSGLRSPRILATNVAVPSISDGSNSLLVLPDRLLVKTGRKWSDVDFRHLHISAHHQRFIEDGRPPRDSQQVGTTWKYVNVKGGPDRRFKDNHQLPVMLYGRVDLLTGHGLHWLLDLSRPPVADWLAQILRSRPATAE